MNSKMSLKALNMMLKKLNDLSGGDLKKSVAILEQSIMNGWKSVYPIDERKTQNRVADRVSMVDRW